MSGPTELGRAITSGGATYFHLWKKDPSHGQWKGSPSANFSGGRHVFPPLPLAWGAVCPPAPTMTPPLARISPLSTRNGYLPHWHKWKCVAPPLSTLRPFDRPFEVFFFKFYYGLILSKLWPSLQVTTRWHGNPRRLACGPPGSFPQLCASKFVCGSSPQLCPESRSQSVM